MLNIFTIAKMYRPCRGWMIASIFFIVCSNQTVVAAGQHLYVTGKVMEIDRCASAWLIKRHVDESAVFAFLTDEELMESNGMSFDTPFSKYRRSHRFSTFESIQQGYKIKDRKVEHLAAIIHDIEINFWNKNQNQNVAKFQYELKKNIQDSDDNRVALDRCFAYLDAISIPNNDN
jgi:hypothetical protein